MRPHAALPWLLLASCAARPAQVAAVPPARGPSPSSEPAPARVVRGDVEPPDPPRSTPPTGIDGFLAGGKERPELDGRAVRFDVDAVPSGTFHAADRPSQLRVFVPAGDASTYRILLHASLYAEVLLVGGDGAVALSAFTGGPFGQGEAPGCGKGRTGTLAAHWAGIGPGAWTDGALHVEMGTGPFDLATCHADETEGLEADAHAIVPGYVYALRVQEASGEVLMVLLPRGAMVATSGDPASPLQHSNTGPFTRLTFSLAPGASHSALVRVSPASMRLWAHMRKSLTPVASLVDATPAGDDLLVGVDVVSQGQHRMGAVTLSLPGEKMRMPYAAFLRAAR